MAGADHHQDALGLQLGYDCGEFVVPEVVVVEVELIVGSVGGEEYGDSGGVGLLTLQPFQTIHHIGLGGLLVG